MIDTIYLDSAAMYPPLPCAREALLSAPFGNPISEHEIGQKARVALEQAREKSPHWWTVSRRKFTSLPRQPSPQKRL